MVTNMYTHESLLCAKTMQPSHEITTFRLAGDAFESQLIPGSFFFRGVMRLIIVVAEDELNCVMNNSLTLASTH